MAGGGGGGCEVVGFHFVCGAGNGASVLCDMATGKQGSSCIVDGSGLVWGACVALTWFSNGGGSSSSRAPVWVAVDCHSAFAFAWAEVLVVGLGCGMRGRGSSWGKLDGVGRLLGLHLGFWGELLRSIE